MMRSMIFVAAATLSTVTGCSFAARSPDMYRDDTQAVLATRNDAIRACYDGVLKTTPGAGGKVTVTFDVETEGGKFSNVAADAAGTTAPEPVVKCVTDNLQGLSLTPPDARLGKATFVYELSAPKG